MLETIQTITEAELNDMVNTAMVTGVFIGMVIGIIILIAFGWMMLNSKRRNFKMWLLELEDDERQKVREDIEDASESLEELAKSNTRLMKQWHNEMVRLKTFLSLKWMQE
jgi:transcription initiation factor IIF auxiliary subunit